MRMNIRPLFSTLCCLFFLPAAHAQLPFWQNFFGGKGYDVAKKCQIMPDGTLLMAGEQADVNGRPDVVLLRYATQGVVTWRVVLGGNGTDELNDIATLPDGSIFALGVTDSAGGGIPPLAGRTDIWVAKYAPTGGLAWCRSLGGKGNDRGNALLALPNGDVLIGCESGSINGSMKSWNHGGYDGWLARLSGKDGSVIWEKHIGGGKNDAVVALCKGTAPGQYTVVSTTDSRDGDADRTGSTASSGKKDIWVCTVDEKGTLSNHHFYGGTDHDDVHTAIRDKFDRLVLAGTTFSIDGDGRAKYEEGDAWLLCINADGKVAWHQTFGGTKADGANKAIATADGGYLLAGTTKSNDGDVKFSAGYYEGWLVKTDMTGTLRWVKSYGFSGRDMMFDVVEVPKGGFILAGYCELMPEFPLPMHKGAFDWWLMNIPDPERPGCEAFVTPPMLTGNVLDRETNAPLVASITLTDNATLKPLSQVRTKDSTGTFQMIMPVTKGLVSINVLAKGYLFYGRDFLVDSIRNKTTVKQTIRLIPIMVGGSLTLDNIYFESGKWNLLPGSYAECERLLAFLNLNPTVAIRINGHTDNTGNKNDKVTLSLNRANAVKNYLENHGIAADRLQVKGWGMSKPVVANDTPEGRMQNRRVEIEVTAK